MPIVFATRADPVRAGLVASLARSGGNITGVSHLAGADELSAICLELLKKAVPSAPVSSSVGCTHLSEPMASWLQVRAQALSVRLQPLQVRSSREIEEAFAAMTWEQTQALPMRDTVSTTAYRRVIVVDLAAIHRLPAINEAREFVEAGGLMSYATSIPELLRPAATYVDKTLTGAKPAIYPWSSPPGSSW